MTIKAQTGPGAEPDRRRSGRKPCACGCGAMVLGQWKRGHNQRFSGPPYREEDRGYTSPCWIWLGSLYSNGYGRWWDGERHVLAHRLYYAGKYGAPEGMLDHLCRVRSCVNPDHLEPVSAAENIQRGRATFRTAEQVREMRATHERLRAGRTRLGRGELVALADQLGVNPKSLMAIVRRERWRNV